MSDVKLPDPVQVIESAYEAANHGDITNMIKMFADDAVINIIPPLPAPFRSSYKNKDEIRAYIQQLVNKDFKVRSSGFEVVGYEVSWHSEMSTDVFRRAGIDPVKVDSHAIIDGSQIRTLDIHYDPQILEKLRSAMGQPEKVGAGATGQ